VPHFIHLLNKINHVSLLELKRTEAAIEYRPIAAQYLERSPLICRLRRAQLAAGPTLWRLPPARIDELECQLRGDGRWYWHWDPRFIANMEGLDG
jgi:hypothetical protein